MYKLEFFRIPSQSQSDNNEVLIVAVGLERWSDMRTLVAPLTHSFSKPSRFGQRSTIAKRSACTRPALDAPTAMGSLSFCVVLRLTARGGGGGCLPNESAIDGGSSCAALHLWHGGLRITDCSDMDVSCPLISARMASNWGVYDPVMLDIGLKISGTARRWVCCPLLMCIRYLALLHWTKSAQTLCRTTLSWLRSTWSLWCMHWAVCYSSPKTFFFWEPAGYVCLDQISRCLLLPN